MLATLLGHCTAGILFRGKSVNARSIGLPALWLRLQGRSPLVVFIIKKIGNNAGVCRSGKMSIRQSPIVP
ncbi:hypothetical protein QT970_26700 [Microcoleus sp. herbarium8]|uniref:hypothetical protein n=1 Tax=Microcoleus sp. herbarium8 TaxID=3055436 RepID=UPI002FCF2C4F